MIELSKDENGEVVCGEADNDGSPSWIALFLKLGGILVITIAGSALLVGILYVLMGWCFLTSGTFVD